MTGGAKVLVSGMVAGDPGQGGASWAVLQYVLGLRRLGHDVYLVEPVRAVDAASLTWFDRLVAAFGLEGRAALLTAEGEPVGHGSAEVVEAAAGADVLLNVSGMLTAPRLLQDVPVRVYLDLDPAFVQLWHAQGIDMRFEGHTHFVTVGLRIGRGSRVPTCERTWHHTLPPVVLERWPFAQESAEPGLTTIANWRGYGSVEQDGVFHGQKAHSLRPLAGLPRKVEQGLRLALAISPEEHADLALLAENGWQLVDPAHVAGTPAEYQRFVQRSWAEFGLAKHGYVVSRCGWFSDRSACYLASGRPVVAQDTGWSEFLPTGAGLLAFDEQDDVVEAAAELERDYPRHRRAARELAGDLFDSDRVLDDLLRAVA